MTNFEQMQKSSPAYCSKKIPNPNIQKFWNFKHWSLIKQIRSIRIIWILLLILFSFCYLLFTIPVRAECPATDYDCQIRELQKEVDTRKDAHEKNKISLAAYEKELARIGNNIAAIAGKLKLTEKEIFQREVDLATQKELLEVRIRELYKKSRNSSPFFVLLSSQSAGEFTQQLGLRQAAANEDLRIITLLSKDISRLESDKANLKKTQLSLASLQKQVDSQATFLRGEVEKTESFFSQIAAKQKELLALKSAGFSTSVGDVPPADDPASRPDYNPGFSPAFAVFSFGAPHRKGMSQYGAYGRAKTGQSVEDILRAYYGGLEIKKDYSTSINIRVSGYGTVDIETYVKRIYEMPSSWGDNGGFEALKAQAVAARSYVLAYTNNGSGSICATESCQVYKPANKGGKWDEAVNATRGWVLMAGGKPFSSWYASTAGGYTFSYSHNGHSTPGLWDTPRGREGWTSEAYEKTAGSPWFYKAWYRLRSGASYGRSHPWLNEAEFSDVLNAVLIYKGNSGEVAHLSSLDANISDTWSMNKVKEEAAKYGGPIGKVISVDQFYSNDGYTKVVYFETDKGRKEFTGEEFKYIFNLRAPGAIGVKSSLFDIRRK